MPQAVRHFFGKGRGGAIAYETCSGFGRHHKSPEKIKASDLNLCFFFRLTSDAELCKHTILIDQPWVSITVRPRRRTLLPGSSRNSMTT
jgi:hypothetical protein